HDAEAVGAGAGLDEFNRQFAGLLEGVGVALFEAHAEGAVEDEDLVCAWAAGRGALAALGVHPPPHSLGPGRDAGHRQDEQQNDEAAHDEEQQLLQAHATSVLLLRRQKEAHGRPRHDAEAPAVEQVDDDGNGDGSAGDGRGGQGRLEEDGEQGYDERHEGVSPVTNGPAGDPDSRPAPTPAPRPCAATDNRYSASDNYAATAS